MKQRTTAHGDDRWLSKGGFLQTNTHPLGRVAFLSRFFFALKGDTNKKNKYSFGTEKPSIVKE